MVFQIWNQDNPGLAETVSEDQLHFSYFEWIEKIGIVPHEMFGRIQQGSRPLLGFFVVVGRIFITESISVLVIGIFTYSMSLYFNFLDCVCS